MMQFARISFILFGFSLIGCGGGPTSDVSGTVTLDGQPLPHGAISLNPQTGESKTVGGVIENGNFTIEKVPEGSYIAVVVASAANKAGEGASMGDAENQQGSEDERERYLAVKNAEGNNKKIEISGGQSDITIALTTKEN